MGFYFCSLLIAVLQFTSSALVDAYAPRPPPAVGVRSQRRVTGMLEMFVDELPEMPKINGYKARRSRGYLAGPDITIGMYETTWKFHRDLPPTTVFAFGTSREAATVPGPTIVARHGVPLSVRWENHLPDTHILPWDPTVTTAIPRYGGVPTVVHLHGGVHPPASDGNPMAWFTSGFRETGPSWSQETYEYPNVLPPGNLWYHDHAEGLTRVNVLAGLLGIYTIHNPLVDRRLRLPTGREFDRHLVIFDRSFSTDGSIYVNSTGVIPELHPQWSPDYFGDAILVNGKAWPFLDVRRRRYRFRILNASNARYLRLSLSNGLPFQVIASDASYLSNTVTTTSVLLAPAEGADVVVDFSESSAGSVELINDAPYPYPTGQAPGPFSGKVMRFNVLQASAGELPDYTRVPTHIANYTGYSMADATVSRYITLYEYTKNGKTTHLDINGLDFKDPVTETPRSGSTEIWYVINLTNDNHPLHIHLAMSRALKVQKLVDLATFQQCMMARKDPVQCDVERHAVGTVVPVPLHERTWKNVVKIEPGYVTTMLVAFRVVDSKKAYPFDATAEPGYVYHCHILEHEDNVMMRPMKLVS